MTDHHKPLGKVTIDPLGRASYHGQVMSFLSKRVAAWGLAVAAATAGCGDDDSNASGTGGSGANGSGGGTGTTGTGASGTFDPDNPGIHFFFTLGAVTMMSQPMELAAAGFMPAAREDFEPEPAPPEIPVDSCVVAEEQPDAPSCAGEQDCAPEQDCLPETDDGGNPIAGTERCVTPRELLDVGPMTVEGFASGPMDLAYNPGQSGAYTAPGSDGTLPAGTLAFDTNYAFHGAGDASVGLGAFSGELYLPAALELTSPPLVELGMPGMFGVEADASQDLALEWSGASGSGALTVNLVGGSEGGASIDCRVTDDGAFAIPAAMVQAAGLADMAFLNMVTIMREGEGTASGDGITYHAVDALQSLVINVKKAP